MPGEKPIKRQKVENNGGGLTSDVEEAKVLDKNGNLSDEEEEEDKIALKKKG